MNILITGGAGFIGSAFVRRAVEEGLNIVNVDKLTYAGNIENIGDASKASNYRFFQTDICDRDALNSIIPEAKPDVIVHMAAESHVDRSIKSAEKFIQTNICGTYTLLESVLEYKNRYHSAPLFLHISTDEVFGSADAGTYFDENSHYKPNSPYSASKASSDMLVRAYGRTYGLNSIIVNASNNYGPCQFPEKLIPLIITNAANKKPLPVYGNGLQVRDWLYVDDHIDALLALIKRGRTGESYCIGANNEITNLDLIKKICSILNNILDPNFNYESLVTFVKDRLGHDRRYATDASKLKNHVDWLPKTSLEEGLLKTVKWYLDNRAN